MNEQFEEQLKRDVEQDQKQLKKEAETKLIMSCLQRCIYLDVIFKFFPGIGEEYTIFIGPKAFFTAEAADLYVTQKMKELES